MDAITPVAELHCCPTCGATLRDQFAWDGEARTFVGGGIPIRFTKREAVVFDALWRARNRGGIHTLEEFAARAYESDRDGGPESLTTISVHLAHIRLKLKGSGYTITRNLGRPKIGYRVAKTDVA